MRAIFFVLIVGGFLFAREPYYTRIFVENEVTVRALIAAGYQLDDVRSYPDGRLRWFAENGFVTVVDPLRQPAAQLQADGFTVLASGRSKPQATVVQSVATLPAQFGWPKSTTSQFGFYGQSTTITDFNNSGRLEVFISTTEGETYMWRHNGTFVSGYPVAADLGGFSTGSRETAAAGDINGDGIRDAIYGRWIGRLYAFQYDGSQVSGFPRALGNLIETSEAALFDFDNDGEDEILVTSYSDQNNGPMDIHIYNADFSELPGWPQSVPQRTESSPTIGDIDGDGQVEIVLGSGEVQSAGIKGAVHAFNLDGTPCSGYPIITGYSVNATASIYDIDLDDTLDVLIRAKFRGPEINGIHAFDGRGRLLPGFPAVLTSGGSTGAPAIADVNGDGLPEIAYGTVEAVDLGKVWLFDNGGRLMPNFPQPVLATWVEESLSLEDVSGDTLADLVCGTNGLLSDPARLWAFDHLGNTVTDFPVTITEDFSSLESTPTIIDIDGDGDTEVFTASHGGRVYAFDTPGVAAASSWPAFKYNAARHGSIPTPLTAISGSAGQAPQQIDLHQNYPNPFNPVTNVAFGIVNSEYVTLTIYDIRGKALKTLVSQMLPAGQHHYRWDGRGGGGRLMSSGVYLYQLQAGDVLETRKMILLR